MIWAFFVRFSVPVLGVFYGTSLIADEVEDKTITYLFTRPIPRGAVLLGKYLAYLVVHDVRRPAGGRARLAADRADRRAASGRASSIWSKDLGVLALGLAVYGAVFALVGAALKRPLLVGLIFVFGWEPLVMALPGYLKLLPWPTTSRGSCPTPCRAIRP